MRKATDMRAEPRAVALLLQIYEDNKYEAFVMYLPFHIFLNQYSEENIVTHDYYTRSYIKNIPDCNNFINILYQSYSWEFIYEIK